MNNIKNLKVDIYADGANLTEIVSLNDLEYIRGFTTNPTLMKNSGVKNYKDFALEVLKIVNTKPISFEVFSDELEEMFKQAKIISSWGENVYIKIPITNTKGEVTKDVIKSLSSEGINVNVTAIFTIEQIKDLISNHMFSNPIILSYFAGRVADTGLDPIPVINEISNLIKSNSNIRLLWASPRELLNIIQASESNCDIITVSNDLLKKISNIGKNLDDFSLDTVKMFYSDAKKAGYSI